MSLSAQSNSEYFSAISEMYWRLVIFKYFIIESSNGNSEEVTEIKSVIKNINPNLEIFDAEYLPLNTEKLDQNQNYLAFSGIGSPDSFIKTLKKNNFKIVKSLDFPDHYNYSNQDLIKIKETAKKLNAKIITTEKDYNRLNKLNSEGIEYLEIELKITNEKELINFLNKKLWKKLDILLNF